MIGYEGGKQIIISFYDYPGDQGDKPGKIKVSFKTAEPPQTVSS